MSPHIANVPRKAKLPRVSLCCQAPGWSAVAQSRITTTSTSWVQAILLPQPPAAGVTGVSHRTRPPGGSCLLLVVENSFLLLYTGIMAHTSSCVMTLDRPPLCCARYSVSGNHFDFTFRISPGVDASASGFPSASAAAMSLSSASMARGQAPCFCASPCAACSKHEPGRPSECQEHECVLLSVRNTSASF
ncbi:hypothetical protein AAY473_036151 [Plecturocebus cupreus]